jgi:hypothetical protein
VVWYNGPAQSGGTIKPCPTRYEGFARYGNAARRGGKAWGESSAGYGSADWYTSPAQRNGIAPIECPARYRSSAHSGDTIKPCPARYEGSAKYGNAARHGGKAWGEGSAGYGGADKHGGKA